jgi:hypothetical protein
VERTNRILCGIIAKVVLDKRREWDSNVANAFWAYRTSHKVATNHTPFFLAYGHTLHNFETIQMRRKAYYDKIHTKITMFLPRDLILHKDSWLIKQKGQKFYPRWKEPFIIREAYANANYKLGTLDGEFISGS